MTTTLRPMTDEDFDAWIHHALQVFEEERISCGLANDPKDRMRRLAEMKKRMPQGPRTPGHHFRVIEHTPDAGSGAPGKVGSVLFIEQLQEGRRMANVHDLWIDPEHRRRGHARTAFLALEDEAARLGLSGVQLHVFGHNAPARALYESLGYLPKNIVMAKDLAPRPAQDAALPAGATPVAA